MNLTQFFEHWRIAENPFRAEEARNDEVFRRLCERALDPEAGAGRGAVHSDFEKILGQLDRPSSSVVFGEKGSGKTAIRLQIEAAVARHNAKSPQSKVLLVAYDDLNSKLDRLFRASPAKTPIDAFKGIRLVDHLDAILALAGTQVIDAALGEGSGERIFGADPRPALKRLDPAFRRDLRLLQVAYDEAEQAGARAARLRRSLRVRHSRARRWLTIGVWMGWLLPAGVLVGHALTGFRPNPLWTGAYAAAFAAWGAALLKRFGWDRLAVRRTARKLRKQLRILGRDDQSLISAVDELEPGDRRPGLLPVTDSDEPRYAMLTRLTRVLRTQGYAGIVVVVDRVDEPTLVSGDTDRMRAVVWPLFNNKLLQQEGVGVKMLLPIELRYALFKESSAFFQEARLDKQGLVERLTWTGPMLYDLCTARLNACRVPGSPPMSLLDLFGEDVSRQDVVDALEQMHQPRDAFKFLYRCLGEHCAAVSVEERQFRIPRVILESVKRQETERLAQLYRGIRPA